MWRANVALPRWPRCRKLYSIRVNRALPSSQSSTSPTQVCGEESFLSLRGSLRKINPKKEKSSAEKKNPEKKLVPFVLSRNASACSCRWVNKSVSHPCLETLILFCSSLLLLVARFFLWPRGPRSACDARRSSGAQTLQMSGRSLLIRCGGSRLRTFEYQEFGSRKGPAKRPMWPPGVLRGHPGRRALSPADSL